DPLRFAPAVAADVGAVIEETMAARTIAEIHHARTLMKAARSADFGRPAARGLAAAIRSTLMREEAASSPDLRELAIEILLSAPEEAGATLSLFAREDRIAIVSKAAT